jgi:pSer/pThr/pTyr-binding forkhead associated (FHA) protein
LSDLPPLVLHGAKVVFVALLYLFLWQVLGAIRSHLKAEARRSSDPTLTLTRSATQAGLTIRVTSTLVLGRSPEADFTLDDHYASDFHVRLAPQADGLRLHDLGSTNGTFVNGERVVAPVTLRSGDELQIGQTIMEIR